MAQTSERWLSARGSRNPVIEIARDTWDSYDNYGSAVEAMFQICYTLSRYGCDIPASWEFRPGADGPYFESELDEENGSYLAAEFDTLFTEGQYRNFIHAGEILRRYITQCKIAGIDY